MVVVLGDDNDDADVRLKVWASTLRRTMQTASKLDYPKLTWKSLDELDAGEFSS